MNRYVLAIAIAATPIAAVHAQTMTAATYVQKAAAGDRYEIDSSRLLLETSRNAKLREFANMMVKDHTNSTAQVAAAAKSAGIRPAPPILDAKGKSDVAALRAARGVARDKLYLTQQIAAHQRALDLHKGYADNGDAAPLRTTAGKIAPVVEHHLTQLRAM